jgi:hypothetical protein
MALFVYGFHGNFSISIETLKFILINKDKTVEVCFSLALLNTEVIQVMVYVRYISLFTAWKT